MLPRRAWFARGRLNCPFTGNIRGQKGSGSRAPERGRGLEGRRPAGGGRGRCAARCGRRGAARSSRPAGSAPRSFLALRRASQLPDPRDRGVNNSHQLPTTKQWPRLGRPTRGPRLGKLGFLYSTGLEVRPSGLWRLVEGWSDPLQA